MSSAYALGDLLQRRAGVSVYRAVRSADGRRVILKILSEKSGARDLARLKNEYEVARAFDTPVIVKPLALETFEGMPTLALEDSGGEPLDRMLDAGKPMPMGRFLPLAVRITAAVAEIHESGVIHKDLKPQNVLVDPGTGEVRIIDFGIATWLPREETGARSARLIEGSLPYISPEQTGRTSRPLDTRSDLYALGVTFYQMLTGRLPFEAQDPLGWVYCHIARRPPPPSDYVPSLPTIIGSIVLKLLAKIPEDRYQSATGLQHDLERCLASWQTATQVPSFVLGERDSSKRFLVPRKLYGRGGERAALLSAFERVVDTGKPALMSVLGHAGIGKSSLVYELQRAIVRQHGSFVAGKFELRKRATPYLPFVQALRELVLEALSENDERLAEWRRLLVDAMGRSAKLIIDLIPELGLVIGPQPPVPDLALSEAEGRLFLLFQRFLGVFARKKQPVVIFLDDLHWADRASLRLLAYLVTNSDSRNLFLIGAYRDDEVGASHPLRHAIDQIRGAGAVMHEVILKPLSVSHVGQIISDAVHQGGTNVASLARLVHSKTGGNPFFVIQFLTTLERRGFIVFDVASSAWRWDLDKIQAEGFTDNVVELVLGKLKVLPGATQAALQCAASVGNVADATIVSLALDQNLDKTAEALRRAIDEDLLLRLDGAYRFPHDRVQEAAYALIPEADRARMHLKIGRLLAARSPPEQLEERVFETVNQLNLGASLIDSQEERDGLAQLNLRAGERARASTAFASAIRYLAAGAALLDPEAWTRRHALAFSLEFRRAECEYLIGNKDDAERRLMALARRSVSPLEAAAVTGVKISLHMTQSRPDKSVDDCLEFMRRIGIDLPRRPTREQVDQAYAEVWKEIGGRQIEDLIDLPFTTDPLWQTALKVITPVLGPAASTDGNLFALICAHMVLIGLRHGPSEFSTIAYVGLGSVIGRMFNDYRTGFRFGKLGMDLMESRDLRAIRPFMYFGFGTSINPWTHHIRSNEGLMQRTFETAVELGNLNLACYSFWYRVSEMLFAGKPIDEILRKAESGLAFARKAGFTLATDFLVALWRLVQSLHGATSAFGSFDDEHFSEREFEEHLAEGGVPLGMASYMYFVRKLQCRLFAADFAGAVGAARRASELSGKSAVFLENAEHHFYGALAVAAHHDQAGPEERRAYREALVAHRAQLAIWAEACPENFLNRHALVCAEIARIEGEQEKAVELYERAIRSARENGFVQNMALSLEFASRFYRARGIELVADAYLREARAAYARWGADGKVRQLDRLHPTLRESFAVGHSATFEVRTEQLDLYSIVRASHRISSEIARDALLRTLMQVVLELSGARTARVLLDRRDELTMGAEATLDDTGIGTRLLGGEGITSASPVPLSIVHYVRRTRTPVLLHDACVEASNFAADDYLVRTRPRSLLCLPILRQAEVVGLLYLENELASGAFTHDHLTTLQLIASQAAISLENALLLEREHAARIEAEAARERAQLLGEVTALLSSVVEYPAILTELARFCVRSLADWAVIDLVEDGRLRHAASAHRDPQLEALLRSMEQRYPGQQASMPLALTVLESGTSLFLPVVDLEGIRVTALDEEHAQMILNLGTGSVMVVPLLARGAQVGALSLAARAPGRYRTRDLEVAEEVARRAAPAIDSARLAQAEARSVMRLAKVALAVKDMTNTPLQILLSSIELLRMRPETTAQCLERMRRAVWRLRQLDEALSVYGSAVRWRKSDEGFDPVAVIEGGTTDEDSD